MKFGRITFFLLLLFILNVLVAACGKQDNKKKTLRTGGKTSQVANQFNAESDKATSEKQKAEMDKCDVEMDDTRKAICKNKVVAVTKQTIAGKPFKATRTILSALPGKADGNYHILLSYVQESSKASDNCANFQEGSRFVEIQLSVDLMQDGKSATSEDITEDSSDLSLELSAEETIATIYDMKNGKKVKVADLEEAAILTKDINLDSLKFAITDGSLVLKQETTETHFEIQDEKAKTQLTLNTTASSCQE